MCNRYNIVTLAVTAALLLGMLAISRSVRLVLKDCDATRAAVLFSKVCQ